MLELSGFTKAMVSYVNELKFQSHLAGRTLDEFTYSSCLENPSSILVSQASSVALTFPSFQDENKYHKHLIRCNNDWRGRGARSDCVFFQNKVVGSKKAEDAFGGKAVGEVKCLFQWKTIMRVGKQERHSLALIDILLPLKPSVGKTSRGRNVIAYLKHHGMFMVEKQQEGRGRQVVDIACFRRAVHVVPTDIWAK
jgi:hypothetical protein